MNFFVNYQPLNREDFPFEVQEQYWGLNCFEEDSFHGSLFGLTKLSRKTRMSPYFYTHFPQQNKPVRDTVMYQG